MDNLAELEVVVLTRPLPEYGLEAGDIGTVVHAYQEGAAFEVEFVEGGGKTVAVVTLEHTAVRRMNEKEILHARVMAA